MAVWVDGGCSSLAATDSSTARITTIGEAWPGMGLASWFIGYIAAPEARIPAMQSQKQIMAICTSTAAQYAALEAGTLFEDTRHRQLTQLSQLRGSIIAKAKSLNLEVISGDAVNIVALRAAEGRAAALSAAGFAAADGGQFGAPDIVRLNVAGATAAAVQALG